MKYRLKKDLPFAEIGSKIIIGEFSITVATPKYGTANVSFLAYRSELKELVRKGWIEEVKPREWETNVINGSLAGTTTGQYWTGDVKVERIKVREVLE